MNTKASFYALIFASLCILAGCGGKKCHEEPCERISGAEHAGVEYENEAYGGKETYR